MKYQVLACDKRYPSKETYDFEYANILRHEYGLSDYYTTKEVYDLWSQHSENYAAGWLMACVQDVEQVFGVTLIEVD